MRAFGGLGRVRRRVRAGSPLSLNLVSLMDTFTILLLFLLVQGTEGGQSIPLPGVRLPGSVESAGPDPAPLTIVITRQDLRINGRPGGAGRIPAASGDDRVMILGDRELPYRRIQEVLQAAHGAGYRRISFVVQNLPGGEGP